MAISSIYRGMEGEVGNHEGCIRPQWLKGVKPRGPTLPKKKSIRDFEISGFHGRFWNFSENFKTSLEISRFQLKFSRFQ